ncbi:hypothetical protein ACFVVX_18315 [Kitasatospora sp. NPDC058170]|uniref:hypothetical protein n=1 Tax=Kitasatospora sp. NPDC058170 TaxID=3346364 RepID=UPI0036DA8811
MSTNRSRRIDRDTAEHLLGGAVGGPSAGQDASLTGPDGTGRTGVARVLAAAAAPATAGELAGEEAALAAFREARLTPDRAVSAVPAPVRRRSMATAALARAFSTKAVAVVLGATALGGVAVAAGTGNLPSPLGGGPDEPGHRTLVAPSTPGSSRPSAAPVPEPGTAGTSAGAGPSRPGAGPSTGGAPETGPSAGAPQPAPSGTAPAPPSAQSRGKAAPVVLVALCRGFVERAGKGERPRLLVVDPLFGPLVSEAGGPDRVDDYCREVLQRASDDERQGTSPQPRDTGGSGRTGDGKTGGTGDGKTGTGGTGDGKSGGTGDGKGGGKDRGTPTAPVAVPPLPSAPIPTGTRTGPDRTERSDEASPRR